jgi:hypothetical protein
MDLRIEAVRDLEHARALSRLVYRVHGLTHHRRWLYQPAEILALNRAGYVHSLLAWDGAECVGHIAGIRPYFERDAATAGTEMPSADPVFREVGLGIVDPDGAGQGVLAQLAAVLTGWAMEQGFQGLLARCALHQPTMQRLQLGLGATPVAMLLGSTPRAMGGEVEGQSLSVVVTWLQLSDPTHSRVVLPETDSDLLTSLLEARGAPRDLARARGPAMGTATRLQVHLDPARQVGRVHVVHAGPDVEGRVLDHARWMLGGRLRHLEVQVPLDNGHAAQAMAAWRGHGMVLGGLMPDHCGRDMLVMQGLQDLDIRPESMVQLSPVGRMLQARVLRQWRGARELPRPPRWSRGVGLT